MRKLTAIVASLLLALAARPVLAQSLTGTILGIVKDQQGGVVPGATVTLSGRRGALTATSDAAGAYRFPALDPGTYEVSVEMPSFAPKKESVTLSVGQKLTVDFALTLGGHSEMLEVVGEAPIVDVTSSASNNSLSQDILYNQPLDRRSYNMYNYAPGINDYTAYGAPQDSSNALLLDGVDTRDPEGGTDWSFYNYNIIQEVQIQGLAAPAEYGAFTGAIVNTITKSGGNQFAGLFDAQYTKGSLASNNASASIIQQNPTLASGTKINSYLDVTGQLSGPIVKDKLFFFISAQRFHKDEDPAGPRTSEDDLSHRFYNKFTYVPGPNDNITLAIDYDDYNQHGRSGQPGDLLSNDNQTVTEDAPEWIWNLDWRHLFSSNTFIEAKYLGWWGYYYLDPVNQQASHFDGLTGQYTGGAGFYYYADRGREEGHVSLSHYAEGWGHHEMKFGIQIERSRAHDRFSYVGGGYFYDYGGTPLYQYQYSYDVQGHNHRDSAFVQDTWKVNNRLTLNLGVRGDWVRGISPVEDKTVYDAKMIAPRIGVAWDATGDHKTVARGSFSQYYDGALFTYYYNAVPGISDYVTLDPSTGQEIGRSVTPIYKVDPNLTHPHVNEYTLGLERALSGSVRLQVTGIYRQYRDFVTGVLPSAQWAPVTVNNPVTNQPLTVYNWVNPDQSGQDVLITNPNGFQYRDADGNVLGTANPYRDYKGVTFILTKRMNERWGGQISYVLQKFNGTVDSDYTLGAAGHGGGFQFQTPTLAIVNSDGESTQSVRNELKAYGSYHVPKIDLGLNATWRWVSGENWATFQQISSSIIDFPPSSKGRRPLLEPPGSNRLDPFNVLDLRIEKIFKIHGGNGKNRLSVYADINNVFNSGTVDQVNNRYPSATVSSVAPDGSIVNSAIPPGGPLSIIPPRQVTFSARWSF